MGLVTSDIFRRRLSTERYEAQFCRDVSVKVNVRSLVLYCIVVGSRRLVPPGALQPKAYCTNPGL